jgi:signal transduction histidine kinase
VPRSLRTRLVIASLLWTGGLLMLMHLASMLLIHTLPRFSRTDATWPVVIGAATMLAGALAAWAGLKPLRRLRRRVDAVTSGEVARIDGTYPAEVQPLIDRLNAMLADRERSVKRARAAAGDLAHSLKTPMALLAREAELARAGGQVDTADAIDAQVRRMASQLDRHLARARVAASGPAGTDRCDVGACAAALVRALSVIHASRQLTMTIEVPPDLTVRIRQDDLEEILGNVLDNACKWARSRVALSAARQGTCVVVTVDDDGAGLPAGLREKVLERGVRLDEAAPGSGLGLAIVGDLTDHYGGDITLHESDLGGLRARVSLPRV